MQRAGTHTAGHTIMKAIVYKTFGPPDVLKLVNHPLPQRSAGELLVKVKSTSLNPVDYKTRNGSIPIAKKNKVVVYTDIDSPARMPAIILHVHADFGW